MGGPLTSPSVWPSTARSSLRSIGFLRNSSIQGQTDTAVSPRTGRRLLRAKELVSMKVPVEVEALMRPETSAPFVLESEGDIEVILHPIRGLVGTVLRTKA